MLFSSLYRKVSLQSSTDMGHRRPHLGSRISLRIPAGCQDARRCRSPGFSARHIFCRCPQAAAAHAYPMMMMSIRGNFLMFPVLIRLMGLWGNKIRRAGQEQIHPALQGFNNIVCRFVPSFMPPACQNLRPGPPGPPGPLPWRPPGGGPGMNISSPLGPLFFFLSVLKFHVTPNMT